MSDYIPKQFEGFSEAVTQMMIDIVLVLKTYGIKDVPASNVMRLLGTDEEEAKRWEDIILSVNENGELELINKNGDDDGGYEIPTYLH